MTRRHLVPCPACARHFRVSDAACPFCGAELPSSLREAAPPQAPSARLSRAALLAFSALGTGALASAPGCGGDASKDTSVIAPPYGLAPLPDAGDDTIDAGSNAPHYGAAPPSDAGADDSSLGVDASRVPDAGNESDSADAGAADARTSELGDATSEADAADGSAALAVPDARVVIAPPYGLAPLLPH